METPPYLADAERLFTVDERTAVVETVSANPLCGVLIPGSGGIRKVRFGFGGRGKSGGARVIYLFGGDDVPVFLLAAFAKNDVARKSGARESGSQHTERLSEAQMSKRALDKIMTGFDGARAYLEGAADKRRYRVHVPEKIDVRKIRVRLGLSQESFAATYGFAVSAVRDWEQGRRRPERSARILLKIVEKDPEAITRALAR